MYTDKTPQDIRIGATYGVSNLAYNNEPDRTMAYVRDHLQHILIRHIIVDRLKEKVGEFHRDFRIDLYVATPEQFWDIVHTEAMKLEARGPIDPFARETDAMRKAIAIYCREELGEIDFEDDAHAIKHFTDKYREENYR